MRLSAAMCAPGLAALLAISGCDNGFAPAELDRGVTANVQATGGVYQLGEFALYLPAAADGPRAVIVALGGPNTKGFVTGEPFGAPVPAVEAALQAYGQSVRQFAEEHRVAILGVSRFGPTSLPDGVESDQLILDALRAGAEASGTAGLADLPILLYGISGGSPEASGFATRHPGQVAGLFLKVPIEAPTMTTELQRQVPVFIVLAEFDAFVDNAAMQAAFAANRANGAPWAIAMEPGVPHHAITPVHQGATLAWMDAVLGRRLAGGSGLIRNTVQQSGWLGDLSTGRISPWGAYSGDRSAANWLPTKEAAEHWRALSGF